jgi:hypothetical protein
MLFLLVTAQRCQTLHLIQLNDIHIEGSQITVQINHLLKQSRPGHHLPDIILESYPKDKNICIVNTIIQYLERTKSLRQEETKLLISTQKPHKGVSSQTISRWVKLTLFKAGVAKHYGAHSTRAASTSAARLRGVPISSIIKTAGWTNANTFQKFYDKTIISSKHVSFQTSIQNRNA